MNTHIVYSDAFTDHKPGWGHPESPSRYIRVMKALKPLKLPLIEAKEATEDELELCHPLEYIQLVEKECRESKKRKVSSKRQEYNLSTGDTQICEESFRIAKLATGGVLEGIDAVIQGKAKNVFCPARPPGHHACSEKGMGFCLFNNIAIGAEYLKSKGYKRILIVDWDAHHGNGTQELFYGDSSVYYFSTHQLNHYPGTGKASETGKGKGSLYTKNHPVKPGKGSNERIKAIFRENLTNLMQSYEPQFILISAGFDAHKSDPLSELKLETKDFVDLTQIVMDIAHTYADDKIVSVMEGGYNLTALAASAKAHVSTLNTYQPQKLITPKRRRVTPRKKLSAETRTSASKKRNREDEVNSPDTARKKQRKE